MEYVDGALDPLLQPGIAEGWALVHVALENLSCFFHVYDGDERRIAEEGRSIAGEKGGSAFRCWTVCCRRTNGRWAPHLLLSWLVGPPFAALMVGWPPICCSHGQWAPHLLL